MNPPAIQGGEPSAPVGAGVSGIPVEWILWQLVDSALPTGGFAHSGGMEAAAQLGEIPDRAALWNFLRASLRQTAGSSLPFVYAAWDGRLALGDVDGRVQTFLSNHVANRASRLQGRAWLLAVSRVYGLTAPELAHGHLATVFGWVCGALGLDRALTGRLFCFHFARSLLSSAVRLNRVGPLEAQAMLAGLGGEVSVVAARWERAGVEDASQCAPLLELWQSGHDRLESRLFQS